MRTRKIAPGRSIQGLDFGRKVKQDRKTSKAVYLSSLELCLRLFVKALRVPDTPWDAGRSRTLELH